MVETSGGTRLANLWDDAKAAPMSEPERLLYRSNLLGSDKRITNYGGGNTSAKVMETDPLTGEPVEVLWVKGSGGDIGTMKLDGFATLYMDKLRALKALYRGPRARGRDGRLPAALHLQPQSARRLDRHAAARLRAATRMSTTCIPTRSSPSPPRANRRALTQRDLRRRDRLAALAAARASSSASELERVRQRATRSQGRGARQPRPLHLGRRRQGLLRDDARHHQQGHRLARRQTRGQAAPSAAQASTPLPAGRAARASRRG